MGKREIGFHFCVTADIWQKFYRNVPGVVNYQSYEFCQNHWFWLVAMATERLNFRKKYSKIFFSEAMRGMKLKLCINVHGISLYINYIFYCRCFYCYGNLKFPYTCTYDGKSGNWHLFLLLQIFWQKFYWNVSGVVLYQPCEFRPNRWFSLVAMATERLNFRKKKNLLLRSHKGDEAETLHTCSWQ